MYNSTLIQRLYGWACERLYHEFAWAYDMVSWLVSGGRWNSWRCAALTYVSGPRVLELGFGTGGLLLQLAEDDLDIHGIDLSPDMHQVTSAKLQRGRVNARLAPVHLTLANAQSLPYPDSSFHTIFSTFPAPYILHPDTLRECARLLAPVVDSPVVDVTETEPASGTEPPMNTTPSKLIIVGMWVSPRQSKWLGRVPVFFGSPGDGELQALAERFRAAGLEPTFETYQDRWADVSVVIAERAT